MRFESTGRPRKTDSVRRLVTVENNFSGDGTKTRISIERETVGKIDIAYEDLAELRWPVCFFEFDANIHI